MWRIILSALLLGTPVESTWLRGISAREPPLRQRISPAATSPANNPSNSAGHGELRNVDPLAQPGRATQQFRTAGELGPQAHADPQKSAACKVRPVVNSRRPNPDCLKSSPKNNILARNIVISLLAVCFVFGAVWRFPRCITVWTGDSGALGPDVAGHPWTPVGVVGIYVWVDCCFRPCGAPLVTVLTFDTLHAFIYCEVGSLASALAVVWPGAGVRQDVIARMGGGPL